MKPLPSASSLSRLLWSPLLRSLLHEAPVESPATKSCTVPESADRAAFQSPGTEHTPASRLAAARQIVQGRARPVERTAKGSQRTGPSQIAIHQDSDSRECMRESCDFPDVGTPASLGQTLERASAAQSCCASSAEVTKDQTAAPPH